MREGTQTYPDVEHEHPIQNSVQEESSHDKGLGELKPWYPQLRQAEEESKINRNPFQEKPGRLGSASVLDETYPIVEPPRYQNSPEGNSIGSLGRGIDDPCGDQRLARRGGSPRGFLRYQRDAAVAVLRAALCGRH